jgi:hypothetical protein
MVMNGFLILLLSSAAPMVTNSFLLHPAAAALCRSSQGHVLHLAASCCGLP